jgi:hypothetical protein
MIFSSLAKFLKSYLKSDKPILNVLPLWMRDKIKENPPTDNAARILQAEFTLQEVKASKVFFVIPKSNRAVRLLEMLKEYIQLMESTRFARWLESVQPKDFNDKKVLDKDRRDI